jgi:hypothetical protein
VSVATVEACVVQLILNAIAARRDDGSLDGVDFRRDILPKLQSLCGART